ncbi:MAG: fumarate hydratase, partial [Chloroflexi bacterium]|nr:fumarate hydratase [Chloroflexota bacterium]
MRNISAQEITRTVARLCQEANYFLPEDVMNSLKKARQNEESQLGQQTLDQILDNAKLAQEEQVALCQDCGTT